MKTKFTCLILGLLFTTNLSFSQDVKNIVALSTEIGDTLSLEERDRFRLLQQIDGFQWAVFFMNPDSSLLVNVRYLEDAIPRDTIIERYRNLGSIRHQINIINNINLVKLQESASRQEEVIPDVIKINDWGAEVQAFTKQGTIFSGELLSVRKNSLLIFNKSDCEDIINRWKCIDQVGSDEIEKLIIERNSNVVMGMLSGFIGGLIVGGVVGAQWDNQIHYSSAFGLGKDFGRRIGSAIGAGVGLLLGAIIGIVTSPPDEVIEPFSEDDISGLSVYAKYPYGEPEDLRKIE